MLEDPPAGLLQERDPLQDVGLGLGSEPLQLGDRSRLTGRAEVGQALDPQRLPEDLDLLGTEAGNPQEGEDSRRHCLAELVISRQVPGRRQLDDLRQHGLADPRHLRQAAVGDHLRQVGRQVAEHLGCVVIGPATKRVLALNLEDRPHLIENLGNACCFHRQPLDARADYETNHRETNIMKLNTFNHREHREHGEKTTEIQR